MSQEIILKEAKQAIALNDSKKIKALLDSTIEVPNELTVSIILEEAALHKRWAIVMKVCQMKGDNKPNQRAINFVTKATDDVEVLKFLCEESETKPSPETIDSILYDALCDDPKSWNKIDFLCFLDSDNKVNQLAINRVLQYADAYNQWELVKKLIQMTGENKPDQKNIESILKEASSRRQWDIVEIICFLNTDNKPSPMTIDNALKNAAKGQCWNLVKKIIPVNQPSQLTTDGILLEAETLNPIQFVLEKCQNKPTQKAIDSKINSMLAARTIRWEIIDHLCALTSENKPSQAAISEAFRYANRYRQFDLLKKMSLMTGDNKPSQEIIDFVLRCFCAGNKGDWDLVEHLCLINSDNKPSQSAIDAVLQHAASQNKNALIMKLCQMKSDNKPSYSGIDALLNENYLDLNVIQFIYEQCETNLSQQTTDKLLRKAYSHGKSNLVLYLCLLNTTNKPSTSVIEEAFVREAELGNWQLVNDIGFVNCSESAIESVLLEASKNKLLNMVKTLCELPIERSPNRDAINKALVIASHNGGMELVRFFCNMETENKPTPQAFSEAMLAATANGKLETVRYLYQLEKADLANQDQIGKALIAAVKSNQLSTADYLLNTKSLIKPTQHVIGCAFTCAIESGFDSIVGIMFRQRDELQINQETINYGLSIAAQNYRTSCRPIDLLIGAVPMQQRKEIIHPAIMRIIPCASIKINGVKSGQIKLDRLTFYALKQAATEGISHYLEWSNGHNTMRGTNGFFTWARHGKAGRDRAEALGRELDNQKTHNGVIRVLGTFLSATDTRHNNHSLSNFLLDELQTIGNSPWWVDPHRIAPNLRG